MYKIPAQNTLQNSAYVNSSQDQTFVYYGLTAINADQNKPIKQPLKFVDIRNTPYLYSPEKYSLSIIRFNVKTSDYLPVFIPEAKLGQSDPNKLIYEITLIDAAGTALTQNITYIPTNTTISINPPITLIDMSNDYYYIYNMNQWIKMMNATLSTMCNSLLVANAFFNYDNTTGKISLYVPTSWTTEKIYFNESLKVLLMTFPYIYEYDPNNGKDMYRLDWYNNNYLNTVTLNSINYYKMEQTTSSTSIFNPVKSIVFESSLFPIIPSSTSKPYLFGQPVNGGEGANCQFSPEITDLQLTGEIEQSYQGTIQYIPSAEYRLFDLSRSSPLSTIEINVYWRDQFNNKHNVYLPPSCSCDILLLFRRKDFGNQTV